MVYNVLHSIEHWLVNRFCGLVSRFANWMSLSACASEGLSNQERIWSPSRYPLRDSF